MHLINRPTRVTPFSKSLIDLIFVTKALGELHSGVQPIGFSDDSLLYVVTKLRTPISLPQISRFRSFKFVNENAFLDDIEDIDWSEMFINVTEFRDVFLKLSDKHAPYVSVRKKVKGSPWIPSDYKELARDRDYCKSQFYKIKCNNIRNENKTTALWKKYTSLRNKANILNKKLKKAYYRSKIESSKDMKESWNIVKELLPDNKANQCSHIE